MATIVGSLFGPTPEELMSLKRREEAQAIREAGQTLGPRGATGAAIGTALARGANKLFGLEDPEVKKATDVYNILKTTQQGLGAGATDPTILYPTLQKNFAEAGYGDIAEKVSQEGATKILDWNTKQATIQQKQFELDQEKRARDALQELYTKKSAAGEKPTQDEIVQTVAPFISADKLATLMQQSSNYAAMNKSREQIASEKLDQKKLDFEQEMKKIRLNKELEFNNKKDLIEYELKVNPNKGAGRGGVYEHLYAQGSLNSLAESEVAFKNISILTNKGINPLTGGAYTGLKGNGLLSATGAQLGQTITPEDQFQYDSIMEPVMYNIAQLRANGRPPTESQIESVRKSLLSKGDTVPYIVQIQKLGEAVQMIEQANKTYQTNRAASEIEKENANQYVASIKKSIPFTGTDVANYTVFKKTNPNVSFNTWLQTNGEMFKNKEQTTSETTTPGWSIKKKQGS